MRANAGFVGTYVHRLLSTGQRQLGMRANAGFVGTYVHFG
jgi:hypothetical protein